MIKNVFVGYETLYFSQILNLFRYSNASKKVQETG